MSDKVSRDKAELEELLTEQLQFLQSSADNFDRGISGEAKRLAVTVRVLVHDTGRSHSLLTQLSRKSTLFLDTAIPHDPENIAAHSGLVFVAEGHAAKYVAMLDDVPESQNIPFEQWWNESVFVDDEGVTFSRKDLILTAANQDGGAHVDPELDKKYSRLSKGETMDWKVVTSNGKEPLPNPERAAIRQIAHEILKTLSPSYRNIPNYKARSITGGMTMKISTVMPDILTKYLERSPNGPCPCGSGKKYKECHGK